MMGSGTVTIYGGAVSMYVEQQLLGNTVNYLGGTLGTGNGYAPMYGGLQSSIDIMLHGGGGPADNNAFCQDLMDGANNSSTTYSGVFSDGVPGGGLTGSR